MGFEEGLECVKLSDVKGVWGYLFNIFTHSFSVCVSGEDVWSYAKKLPHLFQQGGVFYNIVKKDMGTFITVRKEVRNIWSADTQHYKAFIPDFTHTWIRITNLTLHKSVFEKHFFSKSQNSDFFLKDLTFFSHIKNLTFSQNVDFFSKFRLFLKIRTFSQKSDFFFSTFWFWGIAFWLHAVSKEEHLENVFQNS